MTSYKFPQVSYAYILKNKKVPYTYNYGLKVNIVAVTARVCIVELFTDQK